MAKRPDVVILGGGVIGLTTAYYLAKAGASAVVLDQGPLGQEASWAGAGILPPSSAASRTPFDRLRHLSRCLYAELSDELLERTGIDNGYRLCGGLEFLQPTGEAADEEWHGDGVVTERLCADAVLRMEPALAPD